MRLRPIRLNAAIALLFMVGSACFAVGATPAYARAVGTTADLVTFVVGSVFFTLASFGQLVQAQSRSMQPTDPTHDRTPSPVVLYAWMPRDRVWLSAAVQFPGTIFFNVTTSMALVTGLTAAQEDRHVWRPDLFGSCLFLAASVLALSALDAGSWRAWRPRDLGWLISWVNMLGSVAFGFAAVGAYVLPSTGDYVNVAWSNGGTFAGAVCFFVGAALMFPLWRRASQPV